jgi:hypothetical protein
VGPGSIAMGLQFWDGEADEPGVCMICWVRVSWSLARDASPSSEAGIGGEHEGAHCIYVAVRRALNAQRPLTRKTNLQDE